MVRNIAVGPKILVRPRSSLSSGGDENRLKPPLPEMKSNSFLSSSVVCLIGACFFFFALCLCLICFLVLVGKNFASSSSDEIIFTTNSYQEILSDDEKIKQKPKIFFKPNKLISDFELFNLSDSSVTTSATIAGGLGSRDFSQFLSVENIDENLLKMSKFLQKLSFRLPKEILPKHYNLYLNPNLKDKTFLGKVIISFDIVKEIQFVPIHSKKLNISTTNIYKIIENENKSIPINISHSYQFDKFEYWVMEFEKPLDVGEYQVKIDFNGSLTDRIVGFYQSSYLNTKTNETRWIATSKFEPTYARQAFPCFDEPDKKATFKVSLVHPTGDGYHALSNMKIETKHLNADGTTTVEFQKSVPMSTYLACFIVSDFMFKHRRINAGGIGQDFDISVYATPEQVNKVSFALEIGAKITEFYIQYFIIAYPLPKLDMVAIPDFVSGAMEHWGLVTFRETALLYDDKISSTVNKQRVGSVVAHELAHMWFGNLVTMKWWSDLWLNEGFASYIQYKGLHHAEPNWGLMDQFLIDDLHGVLSLDATLASHPIVQTVESPDQITELFDTITYQKGASIIRMLEDFVGEVKFQRAVSNYLEEFSYKNAVTDDLLTHIELLNLDFDVKYVLKTWTEQMGFPVINVKKISNTEYKLTQKRFFSNPEDEQKNYDDSEFNYRWYVPITYFTSESEEVKRLWFPNRDNEVSLKLDKPVEWIKLNYKQTGYYRVNYEEENWKALTSAMQTKIKAVADRAHLLNDVFSLADATQLGYDVALDLTKYLSTEKEYVSWSVAASKLAYLKNILSKTDISNSYLSYAQGLVKTIYDDVGWNIGSDHLKNRLTVTVLELACSMGNKECLNKAFEEFKNWLANDKIRPNPDIRNIVYYYGMAETKERKHWEQVRNLFLNEQDAQEKNKLMYGLSGIRNEEILKEFIDFAYLEKNVRSQDYFSCIQNIASNPDGESLVWNYVRDNWQKLVDRFGLNERYLGRMIPSITGRFSTPARLKEMEDFFNKYPDAGAGTAARKQALEKVRNNIKWLESNKKIVSDWLSKS